MDQGRDASAYPGTDVQGVVQPLISKRLLLGDHFRCTEGVVLNLAWRTCMFLLGGCRMAAEAHDLGARGLISGHQSFT